MLRNLRWPLRWAQGALGARFTLLMIVVFGLSMIVSGIGLYLDLQQTGRDWVRSNSLLLLETMNAVRTYTSTHINPLVKPLMNGQGGGSPGGSASLDSQPQPAPAFIPESVPAFSARTVFGNLRTGRETQDFRYKEAATNPTAPEDRADPFEEELLARLRGNRSLQELSGFRTLDGKLMFYDARPIALNILACVRSHTTPETSPAALVARYGPNNGFGWQLGDVVAAQIVYVPAVEVYNRGQRAWLTVIIIALSCFLVAVVVFNFFLRRGVVRPIVQMAELARRISADEIDADFVQAAPATLAPIARRSDELGQMARVFQGMAAEVYAREQSLRQQVQELRIEIDQAKKASQVRAVVDNTSFRNLQAKAEDMRRRRRNYEKESRPDPVLREALPPPASQGSEPDPTLPQVTGRGPGKRRSGLEES